MSDKCLTVVMMGGLWVHYGWLISHFMLIVPPFFNAFINSTESGYELAKSLILCLFTRVIRLHSFGEWINPGMLNRCACVCVLPVSHIRLK